MGVSGGMGTGSRMGLQRIWMACYWNGCVWYDGVMVLGFGFSYPEIEIMIDSEHDYCLYCSSMIALWPDPELDLFAKGNLRDS